MEQLLIGLACSLSVSQAAGLNICLCIIDSCGITVGGEAEGQSEFFMGTEPIPGEVYPVGGWRAHK